MTKNFNIDENYISGLLERGKNIGGDHIGRILYRAEALAGLSHADVAALLSTRDEGHWQKIFEIAGDIKQRVYGDRVVMFAPLYISDYCVNDCIYCGFCAENPRERKRLSIVELRGEIRALEMMGHKRLALEAGEDPINCSLDYVLECIREIYGMKFESGEIRRVNVNIGASSEEDYRRLHAAGIGTYILFQETYHRASYRQVHRSGPKADYDYHLTAFDRAMRAGIDDVGGGVLFGLYDHAFEVMGLMMHNEHLDRQYGAGFHTISVPRLRSASGSVDTMYPHAVDDETFARIVAVLRLAVPYTGLILSTRESPEMRRRLIRLGVSQVSAGSETSVGGYNATAKDAEQFNTVDRRGIGEVAKWLMDEGFVPSFCTACYRQGRTGDRFHELVKEGRIRDVCLPNAMFTLKEYALDYGDASFMAKADKLISRKLEGIDDTTLRATIRENLRRLESGDRDVFL
ncbi:MAG: [FeFe] hydrogenase H-cluster radical SAM maturase HydG [Defluviitaleaceae bacterium]|nr:[FeFe] hydrogenase H-cluster radical SAM maturase HydG [Defluviitaleaceae bacterium]